MPHKHVRHGAVDKSTLDLPPTQIAQPLPVSKAAASNGIFTTDLNNTKRSNKKRKRKDDKDDTPKAFQRLMAFQSGKRLPKGLDDGVRETKAEKKKRVKLAADAEKEGVAAEDNAKKERQREKADIAAQIPTIRPGERMSEFAARVDAALPVSGLINKTVQQGKDPLGLKVGRTKTEKKMHKLYDTWREEERKIQDQKMNALEDAEEMVSDEDGKVQWKADLIQPTTAGGKKKAGKKNKKRKLLGEVDDGDEDPWAKIARNRGEVKAAFGDVVLAPPTFSKLPGEKFKNRNGGKGVIADVPKASGSLRRREELEGVRKSVVEGYREMMKANRVAKRDEDGE